MVHRLSCSSACGIFQDQGLNLCPLHWHVNFNYCTTREVLKNFFLINLFMYLLFLAELGLCCCAQPLSSCGEQGSCGERGLLFIVVCRLLIAVASLVVEHGL